MLTLLFAATVVAPAAAQVEFLETHVVGLSWNPGVVSLGWRVTADSADERDFFLRVKDRTSGGGWVDTAVVADARTDDDWYVWTGSPSDPFTCGAEYFVQIKSPAGAKSSKMALKMPYCDGECVDDADFFFGQSYKTCAWIGEKLGQGASASRLCEKTDLGATSADAACPQACGNCGLGYEQGPTPKPTTKPTPLPSSDPTPMPTDEPTVPPTPAPRPTFGDDASMYHCFLAKDNAVDGKYAYGVWDSRCCYTTVMTPIDEPAGCPAEGCTTPVCTDDLADHPCCVSCPGNSCGGYPYTDAPGCGDRRLEEALPPATTSGVVGEFEALPPATTSGLVGDDALATTSGLLASAAAFSYAPDDAGRRSLGGAMHPWDELCMNLEHEKAGPIVSVPRWTRVRAESPGDLFGFSAKHFHNLIAGNQFLGATFYCHVGCDTDAAGGVQALARDVITSNGDQYVHLFAMVQFSDGKTEEHYQWLFHITEDIAPVSDTDDTPCPSLEEARFRTNGGCLIVNIPYHSKYRYDYHHEGQPTPAPVGGGGGGGGLLVGDWQQKAEFDGEESDDTSGRSAMSGDGTTVAVGALGNSDNGHQAGHVRVYKRSKDGTWSQRGDDIDGEKNSISGCAVSLSYDGETLAIGAQWFDAGGFMLVGHVRVYQWSNKKWTQIGPDLQGLRGADEFGSAVALSYDGKTLAVGAESNDGAAGAHYGDENYGAAYVYILDSEIWVQRGSDIYGNALNGESGNAIAINELGTIVAVGAQYADGSRGQVRIFAWDGAAWNQLGADLFGEGADDRFGRVIALDASGHILAVGATKNDGGAVDGGHTRVFTWDGAAWNQRGPDIDGMVEKGYSGRIALNGDGTVLAIGATSVPNPDGAQKAGVVRVWGWADDRWHQIGADLWGQDSNDIFGAYTAISADGKTLAVGAPWRANYKGQVRIYELDETADSDLAGDSGNSASGDIGDGNSIDGGVATDAAGLTVGGELSQDCATKTKKRKCKRAAGCKWKRKKKKCRARAK